MLRWILISDATVAVKYPGKLKRYYMRLKKRIGHGRAIVASAHKLVKIIFHMLKENGITRKEMTISSTAEGNEREGRREQGRERQAHGSGEERKRNVYEGCTPY